MTASKFQKRPSRFQCSKIWSAFRIPHNPYSFLSYLHEVGRIYHFINAQFNAVPRQEFRNYMEWASWQERERRLRPGCRSPSNSTIDVLRTRQQTVTADNVSMGVGVRPWCRRRPETSSATRQFHVSEFLTKAADLGGKRVGVVGGGQSGAEAFLDLISRRDEQSPRRVIWISRRPNYFPIDDSPFTNDFYMPSYSDYFAKLDPATRERVQRTPRPHQRRHLRSHAARLIYQRIYRIAFIRRQRRPGRALP